MKCPKCNTTITRVVVVTSAMRYVDVWQDGTIKAIRPRSVESLQELICPNCQKDICGHPTTDELTTEFFEKKDIE